MDAITSFANQAYAAAKVSAAPAEDRSASGWENLAASFTQTLAEHERVSEAAMLGEADPHSLVAALTASQLAAETVATLRDKVVDAYQEILRMPV